MTKYYFKPIEEVSREVYFEHTSRELDVPEDFGSKTTLVIDADNEEDATKIRIAITDIRMWEEIQK
jgi:hypothetical protein